MDGLRTSLLRVCAEIMNDAVTSQRLIENAKAADSYFEDDDAGFRRIGTALAANRYASAGQVFLGKSRHESG